ncbi:phosphotransferase KptA/Tpt1, partial [Blyttiomyces helicus]
ERPSSAPTRGPPRPKDPVREISMAMSKILRHSAAKDGLQIRADGYMLVSELLRHPRMRNVTLETIQQVCRDNDKQRFHLTTEAGAAGQDVWIVRANQGHSMAKVEVEMEEITSAEQAPVVVHGTFKRFLSDIEREGLKIMSRQHIHFSVGLFGEEGVTSGMRKTCDVYIYIDIEKALADGIKFERSQNGVILSSGINGVIAPKYFKKVEFK